MARPLIVDEEHENSAGAIDTALEDMYNLLSDLINYLTSLSNENIIIGDAGSSLQAYANHVANIRNVIPVIGMYHFQSCQRFLTDIETADHAI